MKKEYLLKQITDVAYNVGFGAKKHFATYDIVEKAPGIIAFISMGVGIFGLFIDMMSTKFLSATFLILGVAVIYIERYNADKDKYAKKGGDLTQLFNEIKNLYYKVKASETEDLMKDEDELKRILECYSKCCLYKQVLFSDWYAHYKFFWQLQIDWIDEQKHFKFLRDKVPLSFTIFTLVMLCSIPLVLLWFF